MRHLPPSEAPLTRRKTLRRTIFDLPSDRLIALARLSLSAFSYLAIYLDPSQPARNSAVTYALLFAYLIYSAVVAAVTFHVRLHPGMQLLVHIIDIAVFSVLMHFTDGPTSPFFVFFTFALLTAMLRWDWPGVVLTAFVLVGMLVIVSSADASLSGERDELNRLILRATYLLVAGGILAYVSAIRQRDRERLAKLAAWPREEILTTEHPAIAGALRHAADLVAAPRAVVIWDDGKEPYFEIAHWTGKGCEFSRWSNTDPAPIIELSLQDATFFAPDGASRGVILPSGRRQLPAPALSPEFAATFAIGPFSCAPFSGQYVRGWSLILDLPPLVEGVHALSEILAARIGAELEHFYLRLEVTQAAVVRERERMARNMHDGILQNLTAAGLQLNSLSASLPSSAAARLRDVGEVLAAQQQLIRDFVQVLNPKNPAAEMQELAPQLRAFAGRVSEQWNCAVETRVVPPDLRLPGRLVAELWLMLSEATANAVRHGGARNIKAEFLAGAGKLAVQFRDDGVGYSRPADAEAATALVPFSLSQRVRELGGRIAVPKVVGGFQIDIELPRPGE